MDHEAENRRQKRELARVTEERDILKKGEPWCATGSMPWRTRTSRARPNEWSHWGAIGSSPLATTIAESLFQLLKREWIRRRASTKREAARQDVFEYIEMVHNPKRKHTNNRMLSPVDFEARQQKLNKAGV